MKEDGISALRELIAALRGEDGCPWDRRQTPRSMALYLVEEVFELADAIASGDAAAICEELGDALFQLLFIVGLFEEQGAFDLQAVCGGIHEKMVRRHPHVFGSRRLEDSEQVRRQWHRIKRREKGDRDLSLLDSIPAGTPALLRAWRISERVGRVGFDWPDLAGVLEKAEEEWREFKDELADGDDEKRTMEFGDFLFTLVNVARFAGLHPESALTGAIRKFESRFRALEKEAAAGGRKVSDLSAAELDRIWNQVKKG